MPEADIARRRAFTQVQVEFGPDVALLADALLAIRDLIDLSNDPGCAALAPGVLAKVLHAMSYTTGMEPETLSTALQVLDTTSRTP